MDNTIPKSYTYYIDYFVNDFQDLENIRPWLKYDANKVIISSVGRLKKHFHLNIETSEKYFYHPCEIGQAACAYHDMYLSTNETKYKKLFLANISWLENNYVEYKDAYLYPFPYAIKTFGEKPGWISGMYQGIILSAFVRAYFITNKKKYKHISHKIYNSYQFKLGEKYGFKVEDKYGLWFEESMITPATHILNGFVYAVFGLCDYYKLTNDQDVKDIIDRCFTTLETTLPKYDMGFWSYYDLNGTIASYSYHNKMHIPLLRALYEISGASVFKDYADKWEKYSTSYYSLFRKKMYSFWSKYIKHN